ncbi:MAG TPA: hypothetical protein VII31_06030 [Caldimonas sp.]
MSLPFFSRWLASRSDRRLLTPGRSVESCPPLAPAHRPPWSSRLGSWLGASGWRVSGVDAAPSFGRRARSEALAAARLDFAEALFDVRTAAVVVLLDRIAVTRSLHELWHLRSEIFARVARCHDQSEAARRLASLDRHFRKRTGRDAILAAATRAGLRAARR